MALIPFAGIKPGTSLRWSRGYAMTGKVHFTSQDVEIRGVAEALCGRKVEAYDIYRGGEVVDTLVAEHKRLAKTHVVHTCAGCVARV